MVTYDITYDVSDELFKATVTFDDTKTTVDNIMEVLTKKGYPIQGRPVFLK